MSRARNPRWLKLVLAILFAIVGTRAIATQRITRWFPEVGAHGAAAVVVAIVFLIIAALYLYGWLRDPPEEMRMDAAREDESNPKT
jgi:hypothetical protein